MRRLILFLSMVFGLTACSPGGKSRLAGHKWDAVYVRVNDYSVYSDINPKPFLVFTSDTTVSGNTGCNEFSGSCTTGPDNKIAISLEAVSMSQCDALEKELIYLELLQMSEYYEIRKDTLILTGIENIPQLVFIKNKTEQ